MSPVPRLPDPARAAALEALGARRALEEPADVHEARKHLKRGRAFLRLCEVGGQRRAAGELRRELRDAGRELAEIRDREAVLEALGEPDGTERIPPSVLASLRAAATRDPQGEAATLARVAGELVRTEGRAAALEGRTGPGDWGAALAKAYRRARKAWRRARSNPSADALHELRRRTKDLRYQMEWLTPVWPAVLEGWTGELHALTDDLGRIQDIRVLRVSGHGLGDPGDRRRLAWALQGLRRERRRTLRSAFRRSQRLFAEAPRAFRKRMGALAQLEA